MTTTLTSPVTARLFLFGPREHDTIESIADAVDRRGVGGAVGAALSGLGKAGLTAVCDEVGRAAEHLLDMDVGDVLVSAWRMHRDLVAAGERTLATPGTEELVPLATHKVSSTHRPYVDLYVDDLRVHRVDLTLTLTFLVKGLLGVVRGGRLVGLRTGTAELTAALRCEDHDVAKKKATLDLPLVVPLGDGVPLALPTLNSSGFASPGVGKP